ncbi:type IV pilus modification protein PilV [Dyella sp. M7H15-1]|uniref:type IV pilus modification protein PilV n=1 Tax=Dyella sp. M7H15-1 TaxID=2501295 RepID=UPI00197A9A4E|nr:type IV pilus modification protein PilV [Dyella sp. M7H15-1]
MPYLPVQRGVTLVEVLVALLIFSVGLIGVVALLVMSARSSHAAYLRSQVTFLAQGMADRMQANPIAVWKGDYNGTYPNGASQDCTAGCTPQQLALHDKGIWSSQLTTFLPSDAQARIICSSAGLAYVPSSDQLALRPPYGGSCKMSVSWTEQGVGAKGSGKNDPAPQTFAWEFQP